MASYRERPVHPGLRRLVEAAWIVEHPPDETAVSHEVLPDGCVDIVLDRGGELVVAGPSTAPFAAAVRPGVATVGLRFRPGAAEAVLGTRIDELHDGRVALDEVWSTASARRFAGRVSLDGHDATVALGHLQSAVLRQLDTDAGPVAATIDPVVDEAVDRIHRGDGRVSELGRVIGISDRQLRRKFDRAVGYGPKQLARVVRFQRALAMGLDAAASAHPHSPTWATIAAAAGYSDQPHLVKEFAAMAGTTPTRLVRERLGMSDSTKTSIDDVA